MALGTAIDPAAVGAAVTVGLCGQCEHAGPCRWPHNNEISVKDGTAEFRTLYVSPPSEAPEVEARITKAPPRLAGLGCHIDQATATASERTRPGRAALKGRGMNCVASSRRVWTCRLGRPRPVLTVG